MKCQRKLCTIVKMVNKELWDGWLVEGDIGQTIRNLLTTADKEYMLDSTMEEFSYAIEHEFYFLSPSREIRDSVRDYLKDHKNELFTWFVLQCANEGDIDG